MGQSAVGRRAAKGQRPKSRPPTSTTTRTSSPCNRFLDVISFADSNRTPLTVNALAPALVEVPAFVAALGAERWEMLRNDCAQRYPLGRVATPDDVARCALFLASDDAAFITGQILEISGGARL